MASMQEIKLDVEELQRLLESAERQKVKDVLTVEIRKLQTEIVLKEEQNKQKWEQVSETATTVTPTNVSTIQSRIPTVDLKTYAWDQSDKFMKIYATVQGVQDVPKENVTCDFTERSFSLRCREVKNKNYMCQVGNLLEKIKPEESYIKVKENMVLVMLKKEEAKKTWAFVTEREKKDKAKSEKKPDFDSKKDPQESLMDLMKQMYDDGDDEMKRTIAKAWTESREKKGMGDMM